MLVIWNTFTLTLIFFILFLWKRQLLHSIWNRSGPSKWMLIQNSRKRKMKGYQNCKLGTSLNLEKKHWTPEFLYASPISILINRCAFRHYQFIWYIYPVTFIPLYSENVLHYWGLGIMRNVYLLEINFKHLKKYMLNNTFWQVIEILSK